MNNLLVLHGPNLHLLGMRETDIYGTMNLCALNQSLNDYAHARGVSLCTQQSNSESELIDMIVAAKQERVDVIIFNPAAFTHTSVALRDTLLAVAIPFIEVHISNIYKREPFRHHSYFSDIALGTISGFGVMGYQLALEAALCRTAAPD